MSGKRLRCRGAPVFGLIFALGFALACILGGCAADAPPPLEAKRALSPLKRPASATDLAAAQKLYQKARADYQAEAYRDAEQRFRAFLKSYPDHRLAPNALYWMGECYYSRGNYFAAIANFNRLISEFDTSAKVPDAFVKLGYAYLELEDPINGRIFLQKAVRDYPKSRAAQVAKARLRRLVP